MPERKKLVTRTCCPGKELVARTCCPKKEGSREQLPSPLEKSLGQSLVFSNLKT